MNQTSNDASYFDKTIISIQLLLKPHRSARADVWKDNGGLPYNLSLCGFLFEIKERRDPNISASFGFLDAVLLLIIKGIYVKMVNFKNSVKC